MAERELEIIGVQEHKSGVGKNGRAWTLYKVHAKTTDGVEVPEMTAFFCPPTGIGRFQVDKEEWNGTDQFKLSRLRGSEPSLQGRAAPVPSADLAARLGVLEEMAAAQQRMISELVSRADKAND